MGDLTKNISAHELKCKCGNCDVTILDDEPVIEVVQSACDYFSAKLGSDRVLLHITSGARCYEYNRTIGSNDNSRHPRANAIDHYIDGVSMYDLAEFYRCKFPERFGVGEYPNFVHIDTRRSKARW